MQEIEFYDPSLGLKFRGSLLRSNWTHRRVRWTCSSSTRQARHFAARSAVTVHSPG